MSKPEGSSNESGGAENSASAGLAGLWVFDRGNITMSRVNPKDLAWGVANPNFGASPAGEATILNGSSQYWQVGSALSVCTNNAPFSVAAYFATTSSGGTVAIYGEGRSSSATPSFFFRLASGTFDTFLRNDGNTGLTVNDTATCNNGQPQLVVYTSGGNGGTGRLYRNGVLRNSQSNSLGTAITLDRTAIGAVIRNTVGSFFSGAIVWVATWKRELKPNEVAAINPDMWSTTFPTIADSQAQAYSQGPFFSSVFSTPVIRAA
jgi:hypothetical protein